jgi:hypothetical protein
MGNHWLGEGKLCAAGCGKVVTATNANFKHVLSAEGQQPPVCVSYPNYLGRAVCLTCGAIEELMMQREVLQLREQVDSLQSQGVKKSSWADRLSIIDFVNDEEQRNHNRPS